MEISPYLLFCLLISSVLFGVAVGVLNDAHRLTRVLLGVRYGGRRFDRLYTMRLPFVGKTLGEQKEGKGTRIALPILIFAQDVILFGFAGVGTVLLNFYYNNGQLRLYTVAGLILGFVLYYFTLGKLVMLLSEGIVFFVRAFLTVLLWLFSRPLVFFVAFLGKNTKKLHEKFKKTIANKRKRVYNIYKVKKVLEEADRGVLPPAEPKENKGS